MNKKTIVLLTLIASLLLVACGGNAEPEEANNSAMMESNNNEGNSMMEDNNESNDNMVMGDNNESDNGMMMGDNNESNEGMMGGEETAMDESDNALIETTIPIEADSFYPETVAVHDGVAYTAAFFTGEIRKVDIATGENEVLVEAGDDGVIAGWGLWYDHTADTLLACGNRNEVPGPQENNNAVREVDPASGEILTTWELPAGAACNSIVTDDQNNIYMSDVSTNATIVKIDRASGEVTTWLNDPAWENETVFGVGGLLLDGAGNAYASSGGPLYRVPINDDGTAGQPVLQTMLDADGNEFAEPPGFDGFSYAGNGTMYGSNFDFSTSQSRVLEVTVVDESTVQIGVFFSGGLGFTGVDVDNGTIYVADGQLIRFVLNSEYEPEPFIILSLKGS